MSEREANPMPKLGTALAYAGYGTAVGVMVPPFSYFLPAFYAQHLGVPLAVVGAVVGAVKIYDLAIDPMIGVLSDRTHSRFGRRKSWMAAGVPLLILGLWLALAPPVTTASAAYLALALIIYATGQSMISIPYSALGADIPATPYGRARMLGLREALIMGSLVASSLCPLLASHFGFAASSRETMLFFLGAIALIAPAALIALFLKVPDHAGPPTSADKVSIPLVFKDFWTALVRNKPFRRLTLGYAIINFAIFTDQSVTLFYLSKILRIETMLGPALLVQGVVTVASAPVWIWFSRRFELHRLIAGAVLVAALYRVLAFAFLPPDSAMLYLGICALGSAFFSGVLVLTPTIQAIAIDHGTLAAGQERAATYISANAIVTQLAGALPIAIVFPLLQFSGFSAVGQSSAAGLEALRFVFVYAPLPFHLLGAWMIWHFPISRADALRQTEALIAMRAARDGA